MDNSAVVIDSFVFKGRQCVVIEVDRRKTDEYERLKNDSNIAEDMKKRIMKHYNPYCTGYVEVLNDEQLPKYDDYNIQAEELTFQDALDDFGINGLSFPDKLFIGFDTAHMWNDEQPETKKPPYAIKKCKEIVEELNERRNNRVLQPEV